MKKFLKNEKGMELIQLLGIAAISIVLISVLYLAFNGSFDKWTKAIDKNMTDLLGKFSLTPVGP